MNYIIGMMAHIFNVFFVSNGSSEPVQTGNIISSLLPFFFVLLIITVFVVVRFVQTWKNWKKILEDEKKPYVRKVPKKKRSSKKWK